MCHLIFIIAGGKRICGPYSHAWKILQLATITSAGKITLLIGEGLTSRSFIITFSNISIKGKEILSSHLQNIFLFSFTSSNSFSWWVLWTATFRLLGATVMKVPSLTDSQNSRRYYLEINLSTAF